MTALCGGGTSGPQPGVGGVLTLGAVAIEVFISSVLVLPELAPVIAPIIAGLVDIEIASYCSTDPPADPGLTAAILADAIHIPPTLTTFQSQQKCVQWFEHQYWYNICQCNTVTTPNPATPSSPGTVSTNTGLPVQATPCWNVTVPWSVPPQGTGESGIRGFTTTAMPAGPVSLVALTLPGGPTQLVQTVPMPPGATKLSLTATLNEPIVTSGRQAFVASNSFLSNSGPAGQSDLLTIFNFAGTTTGNTYTAATLGSNEVTRDVAVSNDDTVAHTGTLTFSFFCAPGTSAGAACCPPDPLLEGELQQILQYVQAIYAGLPIPPNSFAEATVHSGLTGNGSITFSGLPIALKVQLTTIPSWVGLHIGDPDFYFDIGWLSFGTSEGNYAQVRLELEHQVVSVPLLAGSVGYTLENGVVATITELIPGP